MEKEESGFKVADRRLFTAEGDLRETTPSEPAARDMGMPTLDASPQVA